MQAGAATQRQVGQGEHVVRFMVGQVDLEQVEASVDGLDEAESAGQGVDGADAADGDAAAAFGDLIVDVAGGHHGLVSSHGGSVLSKRRWMRRLLLASFWRMIVVHSKSFVRQVWEKEVILH